MEAAGGDITLLYGTIVVIDIDRMEEVIEGRGWSTYKPNPATGLLTLLVEELARKWRAFIVYGLDPERGTEEVVMEIPLTRPEELAGDLVRIAQEMERIGVTVTVVAVEGPVSGRRARNRREAYAWPRSEAKRLLERLKRRGGGVVYVEGRIVYASRPGDPSVDV